MDLKRKITKVFQDAKNDLCSYLPTDREFLQELVDGTALNGCDKDTLAGITDRTERRQEMIEQLQEKSAEKYFIFMNILRNHNNELHGRIKKLEEKHKLVANIKYEKEGASLPNELNKEMTPTDKTPRRNQPDMASKLADSPDGASSHPYAIDHALYQSPPTPSIHPEYVSNQRDALSPTQLSAGEIPPKKRKQPALPRAPSPPKVAKIDKTPESKHIMISYQWDSQPTMLKLRDKLRGMGYNVWMDVEHMAGDMDECVAEAVENAVVVLICVSKKYQESKTCKKEAQYASKEDKLIIPLMFENNFKPSGWLGFLLGVKKCYKVYSNNGEDLLESEFPGLIKELGDKGRKVGKDKWTPVKKIGNKALQCSICLERFRKPKMLPCGHSFCKECLLRLAPKGTQTITCPLCRKLFPVPNGDVAQFPTNFQLMESAEEEASKQQLPEGVNEFSCTCCDVGMQSKVVAKCQDCKLYICSNGLTAHSFPGLKHHDVLVFETSTEETTKNQPVEAPAKTFEEQTPKFELKANWWDIFEALYNEEHSIDLFKYWMQQHGKDSHWQKIMADQYLLGLTLFEESGMLSEDMLAKRQKQVVTVFKQAGQYEKALVLIEKTLNMEKEELGSRPEKMADLYYLAADIYREKINGVPLTELDPEPIQKYMKNARQSLKLRKIMEGDDNKFEMGRVLKMLSGAHFKWMAYGGDSTLSAADAKTEGMKYIDESIQIFKQLNAKGNAASSVNTKALLEDGATEEQEKLYREAIAMCEEAYGEVSVLSGRLHYNMCLLYEDRREYNEAYKWLVKCHDTMVKIYGRHHPHTQLVYEKLGKERYVRIRRELEARE